MIKRTYHLVDFAVPVDHRVKNERKQKDEQKLGPCWKTKKGEEHESDSDSSCS